MERIRAEIAELHDLRVAAETEVSDLEREVAKAESDVDAVRQRAARDRARMDTGAVTSAKELESLQHEVESLARRQGDLEEVELELMERLDGAQSRLAELRTRHSVLDEELAATEARRDEQLSEIDRDLEFLGAQRGQVASGVPADLLALYEKLRADHGGVGAAALAKRRCEGCRLELNATDIARIRAAEPQEVLRCEECRRILVRTPESGL